MSTATSPAAETLPDRAFGPWDIMMIDYGIAHQNRINVWMHVFGVPVIVFGALAMIAAGADAALGLPVGAAIAAGVVGAWYWRLERGLATVGLPVLAVLTVLAEVLVASSGAGSAAAIGAGLFVGGFLFQFVGHAIEGAKPALMNGNPIVAMLTAPLFIVAELLFLAGRRTDLEDTMKAGIARREAGLPLQ